MAAPMKRGVAWIDKQEWEYVYKELYSNDPCTKRHALEKIAVWKCRLLHRLSTAIELSWQLMSSQLQDLDAQTDGSIQEKEQQIRMNYSMAVIRFVNLLTEKYQNKPHAQAVHTLAEELGLPEWLVDLRHDATHSALPSLPVLRSAAQFAIAWLKGEYWQAQCEETIEDIHGDSSVREEDDMETLCSLLDAYVQLQLQVLKEQSGNSSAKAEKNELRDVLKDLEKCIIKNRQRIITVVVENKYLVSNVQFESLGISEEGLMTSKDLILPDTLLQVWQPLLKSLHHFQCTPQLVESLMGKLSEQGSLQDRLLAGWIATILKSITIAEEYTVSGKQSGQKAPSLYKQPCQLNGQLLLDLCLKKPNTFTPVLLPQIFHFVSDQLSQGQQEQLLRLTHLYAGQVKSKGPASRIHRLESIERETSYSSDKGCCGDGTQNGNSASPWNLAGGFVDWSQYPLGVCPGQELTYTSLELPQHVNYLGAGQSPAVHSENEANEGACVEGGQTEEYSPNSVCSSVMQVHNNIEVQDLTQDVILF